MYWLNNVYNFFQSFFVFVTFRSKPSFISVNDVENPTDYEFVILNNKIDR